MPKYLSPQRSGKVSIAICGRCRMKIHYNELVQDRNIPGLYVCQECSDGRDPYKLPARKPDNLTLHHPRPDETLE